ncbi:MAG: protein LemA [Methanosaeta sp. SDB]|nr:MAG: protein LemA [Methanosaeta sp. SDB]
MDLPANGSSIILIVSILLLFSAVYFISVYNRLQKLSNGAESTLSQVRVAMKKRLDMIEQLVDSVKSYARFERDVLENISRMRTRVGSADPGELTRIEGESKGVFGNLVAVAEDYPQLKTSEAVMMTMKAIGDLEDEISRHRYTYNNIVQNFNTILDTIPSKYVASSARLRKMDYLNFEEDELRRLGYLTTEEEGPSRPEVGWN